MNLMIRLTFVISALVLAAACGAPFTASQNLAPIGDEQGGSQLQVGGAAGSDGVAVGGGVAQAGQPALSTGGSIAVGSAGASASNGLAGFGGSGGSAGVGGSMPTQAGAPSSGGSVGMVTCLVTPAVACAGRGCGYAPDGCGGRWSCGTPVCGLAADGRTSQSCAESSDGTSSCQVTCQDAKHECGDVPQFGLHCGGCTAEPGGECGVDLPGVCSYCSDNGDVGGGVCPSGQHVWSICGQAPSPSCSPITNRKGQWCCAAVQP